MGLTYPTYLKPVTNLRKRIVRIITFSEPVSHTEPLLKSLKLIKFCDIIHFETLSFVYQWFHKMTPSCFSDYFKSISSVHSYSTRQLLNEDLHHTGHTENDTQRIVDSQGVACLPSL